MSGIERALFLSLRPRFADQILCGSKRVELRRQAPVADAGTVLVLYSSRPVMAVVGFARLERRDVDLAESLWDSVGSETGIDRQEYDKYSAGKRRMGALRISEPVRLVRPVSLAEMRKRIEIEPPQSYRYISHAQIGQLVVDQHDQDTVFEMLGTEDDRCQLALL